MAMPGKPEVGKGLKQPEVKQPEVGKGLKQVEHNPLTKSRCENQE